MGLQVSVSPPICLTQCWLNIFIDWIVGLFLSLRILNDVMGQHVKRGKYVFFIELRICNKQILSGYSLASVVMKSDKVHMSTKVHSTNSGQARRVGGRNNTSSWGGTLLEVRKEIENDPKINFRLIFRPIKM